ncbi:UDP-forming cellulose synthase catalytic subunit [Altericroceibacterium xinjiangense]|uniref:UDP-forming cellulose synthase catalytic subunit n=1 Tax=Altericroceibacterium xinjiangense TaxID=762261 RepID=UPI000F7EF513|nr:UDP-forming cellulose synthase catalytic subunit [Altericroceibacterium xinjiangense]
MIRQLHLLRTAATGVVIALLCVLVIVVPLDLQSQWLFAGLTIVAGMLLARRNTRQSLIALGILSLIVSSRYIFWRTTQTLDFQNVPALILGSGLYIAELYAWLILALGLLQTAWPLERPPVEIEGEPETWPLVDVFIPTYNESLAIVRGTVFAAMDMDYPEDRFRVYILDDGRRPEFREFAHEVGCGYLTRPDNTHAKAGNLNTALGKTSGELVTIFDCDHVPTRAFLQMTVGWFQKDQKLALLQTPHHFYSPDPVQRNLDVIDEQPGEGDLFYGPIQKGNDLWNAAFFCGSCAVIRRQALQQTNGFAGETVTEDAHTALKLQRMGWNTGYLGVRLAAGLATERLALHVGQRIRWARGMTQILRIDNPLFGRGLRLPQRLSYLNAMLHFQFPLPRIVFLTSPLAFLLFGANIIQAPALMIFAYALPHLYCSMVSGTRSHGHDRRPFWSEIYETLLAFHLVKPTVLTWFSPRKGKFNVTDKGEQLEHSYFDAHIVKPHLICIGLVLLGITVGAIKLAFFPQFFGIQLDTFVLNTAWATFSLLILIASVAVANESRQRREHVRIPVDLPVTLHFSNGHIVDARTKEVSMGGLSARFDPSLDLTDWGLTHISLSMGSETLVVEADALRTRNQVITLRFQALNLLQERQLIRAVMGRADAWVPDKPLERVTGLRSFIDIVRICFLTVKRAFAAKRRGSATPRVPKVAAVRLETAAIAEIPGARKRVQKPIKRLNKAAALLGLLLVPALLYAPSPAHAQNDAPAAAAKSASGERWRREVTLRNLGVRSPVRLEGVRGEIGIPFGMRRDEVVTGANLTLDLSWSPALLGDVSQLVILLNDEVIHTIRLTPEGASGTTVTFPVDSPLFLPGDNRLNLRLLGHYSRGCEDPFHSSLWANVSNLRSRFQLTFQKLPLGPDLARLPRPFFDPDESLPVRIPFVFAKRPDNSELEAAASMASWLGSEASYRGFDFQPVIGQLPKGNAIVFLKSGASFAGLPLNITGPSAQVMRNPADSLGQILVIMGRDDEELRLAAAAIASGRGVFQGEHVTLSSAQIPNYPAYGAPRWLRTDRPVKLGELTQPTFLQGSGIRPGPLSVQFQAAPDLFFWPRQGGQLDLHYRYPVAKWLDKSASRLDVSLNGEFQRTLPLGSAHWWNWFFDTPRAASADASDSVLLPRYYLYGQNNLVFDYQMLLADKQECRGMVPQDVHTSILPDSTIDLTGAYHALQMPNLATFANGGYPFTIYPDLAQTAVLLGPDPSDDEIRAFLILMGRFGDSTGAAATRVNVVRGEDPQAFANNDLIVIGDLGLMGNEALFSNAPLANRGGQLTVTQRSPIARMFHAVSPFASDERSAAEFTTGVRKFQGILEFESPFEQGRTVVAVLADRPGDLPALVQSMANLRVNAQIQGDLAVFDGSGIRSFAVGPGYWVGSLPLWIRVAHWFSTHPLLLAAAAILVALFVSGPAYLLLKRQAERRLNSESEL